MAGMTVTPSSAQRAEDVALSLVDPALDHIPSRFGALRALLRNPIGMIGAALMLLTVLTALFGRFVWTIGYSAQNYTRLKGPSWAHPLGTDNLGRDQLSRIIHGAQVSIEVGIISVAIALALGLLIGVTAAFYGRFVDAVLMRIVDILFAIPSLVLAILISGLLGPSRTNAMIAIGIVFAPSFARVIRGSALTVMSLPYVEASRALGVRDFRIMTRHILRNIISPIVVLSTIYLSSAILTEASLSFLGLGTQPPEPSWGSMLKDGMEYMEIAPWLAIFPGLAIMVVVLGLNFLGDGLRDVLDPRIRDA
jgi:peptide/nickel transport system permease protein